ncbi:MAG: sulfatase, partial [Proteobacteria bacterium]|nr:sulfatase [Pseudomonadota bacterium]
MLSFLLALLLVGCGGKEAPEPALQHLIVISIDTLRADYLGTYGNTWVQSPHLDQLASESVVFDQHISVAPTTVASHAALFTGTYPHTHGSPRNGFPVAQENLMLAEVLGGAGFETAAFIGGYPLAKRFGFNQGFDLFDMSFDPRTAGLKVYGSQRSAENLTDSVIKWVSQRGRSDKPFFLFMHFFDVHAPYMAPPPYTTMYRQNTNADIKGTVEDTYRVKAALRRHRPGSRQQSAALAEQYAGEVTYVDAQIGRLIAELDHLELLDQSAIVITADHGETMDEHPQIEGWDHGYGVFDTTLHTPLIIRLPGKKHGGRRLAGLVGNIDVMPTLLELFGVPVPKRVEGTSFLPALEGRPHEYRKELFVEATKPSTKEYEEGRQWLNEMKQRGIRTEEYKLIHNPMKDKVKLYDLNNDPAEDAPLLDGPIDDLKARLDNWHQSMVPLGSKQDRSSESLELLEALG